MARPWVGVACVVGGLSGAAHGEVMLYGVIDAGAGYLTSATRDGHSQKLLNSGANAPTRLGFKGREDLGDGYAAFFQLEHGLNVDTGADTSAAAFWNRFSLVGLDTPWGAVSAGRQGGVSFDKTVFYEPLYLGNFSQASLNAIPVQIFKLSRTVKYQSKSYAGFNVDVTYGFGAPTPTPTGTATASRYRGVALEYAVGPVKARVLRETSTGGVVGTVDLTGSTDRRTSAAVNLTLPAFTLFADYTRVTGDLQLSPNGSVYTVGAAYRPAPPWYLVAEAGEYRREQLPGRPKLFNLLAQYYLSKRTSLYAIGAYAINAGNASNGVVYATTTPLPGQPQLGVTFGVTHAF